MGFGFEWVHIFWIVFLFSNLLCSYKNTKKQRGILNPDEGQHGLVEICEVASYIHRPTEVLCHLLKSNTFFFPSESLEITLLSYTFIRVSKLYINTGWHCSTVHFYNHPTCLKHNSSAPKDVNKLQKEYSRYLQNCCKEQHHIITNIAPTHLSLKEVNFIKASSKQ